MTKEKFIKSTIILIIGGAITKFLGMFIRIVMTRLVGLEGISLYMLIYPTFSLFMTLSQLSMPVAISKLVAEDTHNNKKVIGSAIPLTISFNLLLIITILLIAPFIAKIFLQEPRAYLPILAIALVLPFDAISNLLRGYFFGKQQMLPHVISHILEQLIRLTLIIIITPTLIKINITYAVAGLVLVNIISELLSITIFFFFLPRNFKITVSDFIPNKSIVKNVLDIAIPTTGGRLIGSIGYFLEPIVLTASLLATGYSNQFILTEYGIISGYVMPILLLPGFFTNALSSALLPVIAKANVLHKTQYIKDKLKQAIFFSLLIGIPFTLLLVINPGFFLNTIYHTSHGSTYLRLIAPIFLMFYVQAPLAATLQGIDMSKYLISDNLLGIIIKIGSIYLFSLFHIGMYPLLIATSLGTIITTLKHYLHIRQILY
ncbi:MAG: oligosaccharide flippase family protein [Bacilli bacterium]